MLFRTGGWNRKKMVIVPSFALSEGGFTPWEYLEVFCCRDLSKAHVAFF